MARHLRRVLGLWRAEESAAARTRGTYDESALSATCHVATCVFDVVNFIPAEVVNFWGAPRR